MNWNFTKEMTRVANLQVTGFSIPLDERFESMSSAEWSGYGDVVLARNPSTVIDIACGLGRVSCCVAQKMEENGRKKPHFIMCDTDFVSIKKPAYKYSGNKDYYNSFPMMFDFLRMNGINDFEYVDVERQDIHEFDGRVDMIISMLGFGFHIPLADCIDKFYQLAREDTIIILGIPSIEDMPDWETEQIRRDLFSDWEIRDIKPTIRTHQTRIVIIGGKI